MAIYHLKKQQKKAETCTHMLTFVVREKIKKNRKFSKSAH